MLGFAKPTNISGDWNVIRRIGEDHACLFFTHDGSKRRPFERTPAKQLMLTQQPQISGARYRTFVDRRQLIRALVQRFLRPQALDQGVNLRDFEANYANVKTTIEFDQ